MLSKLNKIAADMLGMQGFPLTTFSRPGTAAPGSRTAVRAHDAPASAEPAAAEACADVGLAATKVAA